MGISDGRVFIQHCERLRQPGYARAVPAVVCAASQSNCDMAPPPLRAYCTFGDGDLQVCGNMASPTSAFGSAAGLTYIVFPKAYKDEGRHRRGNSTFTDVTDGNDFVPQEIEVWAVV